MLYHQNKPIYYPRLPLQVSRLRDMLWLLQDAVDLGEVEVGEVQPMFPMLPMFNMASVCEFFPYGTSAAIEGWARIVDLWPALIVEDPGLLDLVYRRPFLVSKAKQDNTFWWLFGAFWASRCPTPLDMIRRLDYWSQQADDRIIPMSDWLSVRNAVPERTFIRATVGVEELMALEFEYRKARYRR